MGIIEMGLPGAVPTTTGEGALLLAGLVGLALGLALWLRPWRTVGPAGPPWPWLALWVTLPGLWALDQATGLPIVLPWSGASLLVLMCGWPLAVLAMAAAALALPLLADLGWAEALHRLVWLGLLPATLALGLGALLRRWLPRHLFVYILGRGFFGTLLVVSVAGWLSAAGRPGPAGTPVADLMVAQWLAAFGEAFLSGMITAIGVAFRPHWLATYTDRLYLPPGPRPPA